MMGKLLLYSLILFVIAPTLQAAPLFQIYNPDNLTNPQSLFDGQDTGDIAVIGNQKKSFIIFDAKRMVELDKIIFYFHSELSVEDFKSKVLERIIFLHSPDIVSWQMLNEEAEFVLVQKEGGIIQASLNFPNQFLQYIKLSFDSVPDKTISLSEIIFESPAQKPLEISSVKLKTDPDKRTSAELFVQFNRPVKCQVKYDSNYNYVYSKKLDNNLMNVYEEPTQRFILSNLMPNTTYVYQITAQGDGQEIESQIYKFSTIKQ